MDINKIDKSKLSYIVITEVPEYDGTSESEGNHCDCYVIYDGRTLLVNCKIKPTYLDLLCTRPEFGNIRLGDVKTTVFTIGEIIVVNDYGREIIGKGRSPRKWFIEYEEFNSYDKALDRAIELRDW